MSVNYAAGLSDYPYKGKCGQPEYRDTGDELPAKVSRLADLFKSSKYCVVLTGAGISTSCGIPDFRGPNGVWTLEQSGSSPNFTTTFDDAKFSIGHRSLVALEESGYVKYVITQNVDGLHLRSGFPRDRMAILHGDMFTEQCDKCRHQYIRKSSVKTMGLKHTGNGCGKKSARGMGCRGRLKDTILDWEDSLPDDELEQALEHSSKADLFLVLGSSLQIVPAGNLPLQAKKNNGTFVSVNLQRTKHHKKTDYVIHASIDEVMKSVCEKLGVVIPQQVKPTVKLHSVHCDLKSCRTRKIDVDADLLVNDLVKDICVENKTMVKQEKKAIKDDIIDLKRRSNTPASSSTKSVKIS